MDVSCTFKVTEGARQHLDHAIRTPVFATSQEWVAEWVELQPLSRFRSAQFSIKHPDDLLRPDNTESSDWTLFWMHTRQVVFGVLLGLRLCCPHLASPTVQPCCMEIEKWAAWRDDVLWVLGQLLNQ